MPLMNWFRGLTADVARANDELSLHAALDMVHIEVGPPEDPNDQTAAASICPTSATCSAASARRKTKT